MKSQVQTLFTLFTTASGLDQKSEEQDDKCRVKMEDESPPLINLGLGIGGYSCCSSSRSDHSQKDNSFDDDDHDHDDDQVKEREGCRKLSVVRFTEEQLEELKRQLLIFKYMVWGLPVPLQLLLPIWRGFSSSFAPPCAQLYWKTPFLPGFFRGGINNRYMMDPEPGRCRRTDGKKWRCHKSVIPNEKYCERHMHRGSKRSRKLVEASPNSGTANLNRNDSPSISNVLRPKFAPNLDQKSQPLNTMTKVVIRAPSLINTTAKSNEKEKQNNQGKHNSVVNERVTIINLASGLNSSSKSILQDDHRCQRVESCKNNPESEAGRCRRTDGKKWRCRKEVLPDQKYCSHHINRGRGRSKNLILGSSASREAQSAYGSASILKSSGTERAKMGMTLDTDLNISLTTGVADPRHNIEDRLARNGGSNSSADDTESDESTDVSDIIAPSP